MKAKRSIAVLLVAAAAMLGAIATVFAGGLTRSGAGGAAMAAPFRTGEKLFYQVGWMSMTQAATAELSVLPRLDFYGHNAWHFQAVAHTQDPLRYVMILDDQFDSYADARSLVTRQYEMYLNEQGKKATKKFALNEGRPGSDKVSAPAGTRDPLAVLYALRANDWQRRPEMLSPVYDGTHFYQMMAHIEAAHDSVIVPAGTFNAMRIGANVSSRDSGASMQFTIWLANDPARTPVEVDADVPVGTVRGVLVRVQ
ncbi:MAG: DUF3108 domain-containing protein [Acidobacteriota bacterium]|nr:DUF3108 domain-containing protein [Acidobacteriota bacterium]